MQPTATVLVYSDDANTREQVRLAAGPQARRRRARRSSSWSAPPLPAVLKALEQGGIDVCVLDGETVPAGGMGVCRQIKDEIFHCPPVLLLIGRPQDAWLATWSRAEAAVTHPGGPGGVRRRPGRPAARRRGLVQRLSARRAAAAARDIGSARTPRAPWTLAPGAQPRVARSGRSRAASGPCRRCRLQRRCPCATSSRRRFQSPKPLPNGAMVSPPC